MQIFLGVSVQELLDSDFFNNGEDGACYGLTELSPPNGAFLPRGDNTGGTAYKVTVHYISLVRLYFLLLKHHPQIYI